MSEDHPAVALRVDYDDADDLLADYTENLSTGKTLVAGSRRLELGTEIVLTLSFPGLIDPIRVAGAVRSLPAGDEPMLGIEFAEGPARDELATVIARIRVRDPKLVKRLLRVLVVEDNPHVAELIRHALGDATSRGLGPTFMVDCRLARDGREALQELNDHQFDALIVDVYLPVIDGATLIAAVRGKLGRDKLSIIAVSAGGDSAHQAAMTAGADVFLDKPMRLRSVIDTVRSLMKLNDPR